MRQTDMFCYRRDVFVERHSSPGHRMRRKIREIRCIDEIGQEAVITEWCFGDSGSKDSTTELRLEDGAPVSVIGGIYEHFYTGKMFQPL